jgi:hypothetical protein
MCTPQGSVRRASAVAGTSGERVRHRLRWRRGFVAVLIAVAPACGVEGPTEVTVDQVDAWLLTNGAIEQLYHAHDGISYTVMIASDEARWVSPSSPAALELERTGELLNVARFATAFTAFSHARELTALATGAASQRSPPHAVARAHLWHGWTLLRSAEVFGDQPIRPGDDVLTASEVVAAAERSFRQAIDSGDIVPLADRHRALAGVARAEWILGREPVSRARLERAREAALAVLSADPGFDLVLPFRPQFLELWKGALDGGMLIPNPPFAHIPGWWQDPSASKGVKLIDADELHLIVAESHLLLDEVPAARTALAATPILSRNHVGIVRRRVAGDPLLTAAEIETFVAALDDAGVRRTIDELRREIWYGHGRRNVGPRGPLMPTGAPAGAW